jgi:hypothetical protein
VRTIDLSRVTALEIGGRIQHVSSPSIRQQARSALSHQLGLDLAAPTDGAA